mgnify:CR=1 FL=1
MDWLDKLPAEQIDSYFFCISIKNTIYDVYGGNRIFLLGAIAQCQYNLAKTIELDKSFTGVNIRKE